MPNDTPFKLIVAVDFSEMTNPVLAAVASEAARHDGVEIHAVCVIERTHDSLGQEIDHGKEREELEKGLHALVASQLEAHRESIQVHARTGRPAEEIIALAAELQADRIVVGRHSRQGTRPDMLGSVPARILQLARCDVVVVQPTDYGRRPAQIVR